MTAVQADISTRCGRDIPGCTTDLNDFTLHVELLRRAERELGGIDIVLLAHGSLPDQQVCQDHPEMARREWETNFTAPASLLTDIATYFESRNGGKIAVITSVAGDRGRASNYIYGAAKGGLSTFLAGMRHRFADKGITVTNIKPGFVDTPMTAHIEPKGLLWAKPEQVARGIVKAVEKGRGDVYLPWFWRWILLAVRLTPSFIFHKTKF